MNSKSSSQQSLGRQPSTATNNGVSLTSQQAAHAVLFTNELLCDIVGRLPFKDIISATGICKFWREALQSNQHIQEALFLEPAEIREVICQNHRLNDLEHSISIDSCMVLCKTHPYLDEIICDEVQVPKRWSHPLGELIKFEHPSGTWRKMFITQPPCKKVTVEIETPRNYKLAKCARSTGVKFGELYDLIHSIHPHGLAYDVDVWVTVSGYADEDCMPRKNPSTTRCKVLHGKVLRPEELPVPVISSEIESFEESDDYHDDYDWDDDFDGTEERLADDDYYGDEYDDHDYEEDDYF